MRVYIIVLCENLEIVKDRRKTSTTCLQQTLERTVNCKLVSVRDPPPPPATGLRNSTLKNRYQSRITRKRFETVEQCEQLIRKDDMYNVNVTIIVVILSVRFVASFFTCDRIAHQFITC